MQLVLDTNVVLDLLVFDDLRARPLSQGLQAGRLQWIATAAMREELSRVLAYPKVAPRLALLDGSHAAVMAAFDRHVAIVEAAARAPVTCGDADDQKFIDLAVAHRCTLLSKDKAVLRMRKRLAGLQVTATTHLTA